MPRVSLLLIPRLQRALAPDLLREPWRSQVCAGAHPHTGHCYVAAEALFHQLGGKAAGYTPMFIRHEGQPHWFLRGPDGSILDPTAGQFRTPVPYSSAVAKGFLTTAPSKRAQELRRRAGLGGIGADPDTARYDDLAEAVRRFDPGKGERNPTQVEWLAFARHHRVHLLGSGASRVVFDVDGIALKIEMAWPPWWDNSREARMYEGAPPRIRALLVPILARSWDYHWLAMPIVISGGTLPPRARKILEACGIRDFSPENIARDGRLLDYGYVHDVDRWIRCARDY